VWTIDAKRGQAIAARLRAGAVMVNDAISYFGIAEAPHGGCGASGWGRTHGKAGLLEMVQAKYIDVDRLPAAKSRGGIVTEPISTVPPTRFCDLSLAEASPQSLENARGALKTMFRDHGF